MKAVRAAAAAAAVLGWRKQFLFESVLFVRPNECQRVGGGGGEREQEIWSKSHGKYRIWPNSATSGPKVRQEIDLYLHQKMCRIHLNLVQLSRGVLHKIQQCLSNVVVYFNLISMCPGLDVNHRHSSVDQSKISIDSVDNLQHIGNHLISAFISRIKLQTKINLSVIFRQTKRKLQTVGSRISPGHQISPLISLVYLNGITMEQTVNPFQTLDL